MMKSRLAILAAAAALLPGLLRAQSKDHVVIVSNTYEASPGTVLKSMPKMEVPDSLLRFDLDYDYSVMDNPYKGSYEFTPRSYVITPEAQVRDIRNLFISAGAGYTLHPEALFAWTGAGRSGLTYGIRGNHRSYWGDYHEIFEDHSGSEILLDKSGNSWKGYDMTSGLEGWLGYEGRTSQLAARLFYDGVMYNDIERDGAFGHDPNRFNSFGAAASYRSTDDGQMFGYNASVLYRYSSDKADNIDPRREHLIILDGSLGPRFGSSLIVVDVNVTVAMQKDGDYSGTGGLMNFKPHYDFSSGRWHFSLGAALDAQIGNSNYTSRWKYPYPALKVRYEAVPSVLDLYATAEGRSNINSYFSQVSANHFCNSSSTFDLALSDFSFTPLEVALGVRGRVKGALQYDFKAGYSLHRGGLLDGVNFAGALSPMISLVDYNKVFATLKGAYRSDKFEADGLVNYCWTDAATGEHTILAPAAFTGDVSGMYRFSPKFSAGAGVAFSTSRKTGAFGGFDAAVLPGWVDISLKCNYAVSRSFSLWARASNLAAQTIQRNPLYAEKGISATLGISWSL